MGISRGRDRKAPSQRSMINLPHSAHAMITVTNHKEISLLIWTEWTPESPKEVHLAIPVEDHLDDVNQDRKT